MHLRWGSDLQALSLVQKLPSFMCLFQVDVTAEPLQEAQSHVVFYFPSTLLRTLLISCH